MFKNILSRKQDAADAPEGAMGYVVKNQCDSCRWFHPELGPVCSAFPEGIPTIILLGEFDHSVPYSEDGVDDGGLVYTPADSI